MPDTIPNLEVLSVAFSLRQERLCVLLVPSSPNCRALPGATIQLDQSIEDAARQRIAGLTGLRETYLEQLYTYSEPAQPGEKRLISVVYFALLPAAACLPAYTYDAGAAAWFPVDETPDLRGST